MPTQPLKELSIAPRGEFITLGQMLKALDFIDSGSEAKMYLSETTVFVNGEIDERRGRKLRPGDEVIIQKEARISVIEPLPAD